MHILTDPDKQIAQCPVLSKEARPDSDTGLASTTAKRSALRQAGQERELKQVSMGEWSLVRSGGGTKIGQGDDSRLDEDRRRASIESDGVT